MQILGLRLHCLIDANPLFLQEVSSDSFGKIQFSQIPLDDESNSLVTKANGFDTGRPSYFAVVDDREIYLYHVISEGNVAGRWIINDKLGSKDQAISYIFSWAIAPHLTDSVNELICLVANALPSTF